MTNRSVSFHCLFFGLAMQSALGQNLVPNGSFEQMMNCPDAQSQLDHTAFWFSPTTEGSPDYYHACSTSGFGVPMSAYGEEPAHEGDAYAGIYLYIGSFGDAREYLEVALTHSLDHGTCYHLEFHVSLTETSDHTTDGIGAYLSVGPMVNIPGFPVLDVEPCLSNPVGVMVDTSGWLTVSGDIIASGGEQYLVIGNFRTDAECLITPMGQSNWNMAYAYIDDILLETCTPGSIDEAVTTNADEAVAQTTFSRELAIAPSVCHCGRARIMSTTGVLMFTGVIRPGQTIRTEDWATGIYLIEVRCSDGSRRWSRALRME